MGQLITDDQYFEWIPQRRCLFFLFLVSILHHSRENQTSHFLLCFHGGVLVFHTVSADGDEQGASGCKKTKGKLDSTQENMYTLLIHSDVTVQCMNSVCRWDWHAYGFYKRELCYQFLIRVKLLAHRCCVLHTVITTMDQWSCSLSNKNNKWL